MLHLLPRAITQPRSSHIDPRERSVHFPLGFHDLLRLVMIIECDLEIRMVDCISSQSAQRI